MNNLSELYFNIQSCLFPIVKEEIGKLTKNNKNFKDNWGGDGIKVY